MESRCLICERIRQIKENKNKYFVKELETGYVVVGDHQLFRGYSLFLCKEHVTELHYLDKGFREKFLIEMSIVAEAVFKAFMPRKLNYELLGNGEPHLHWHIFPRHADDPNPKKPVWVINKESKIVLPSSDELEEIKGRLLKELRMLI